MRGSDLPVELAISEPSLAALGVSVQSKVQGFDKGIIVNGQLGATMSRHEAWSHVSRHDIVNVAPGMDILLALGVSWIRADKAKQDTATAVAVA